MKKNPPPKTLKVEFCNCRIVTTGLDFCKIAF